MAEESRKEDDKKGILDRINAWAVSENPFAKFVRFVAATLYSGGVIVGGLVSGVTNTLLGREIAGKEREYDLRKSAERDLKEKIKDKETPSDKESKQTDERKEKSCEEMNHDFFLKGVTSDLAKKMYQEMGLSSRYNEALHRLELYVDDDKKITVGTLPEEQYINGISSSLSHTTSFEEQPVSDRTFSRFRRRCLTYEAETGIDLIRETVKELSGEMTSLMNINGKMKRMDSLMVASNIRKLGRMELLYTCVADFVTFLHRTGMDELLAGMEHYYDPGDYNRVIYHSRSEEAGERIRQILADADKLLSACEGACDESAEYQLLVRVMKEQTVIDETGARRLKTKDDGQMGPQILQNPSDPDATYREKAGKQNRGYSANVIESVGNNGSIVTDYQYDKNIHSDSQFLKEAIDSMEESS